MESIIFYVIEVFMAVALILGSVYLKKQLSGSPAERALKEVTRRVYKAEEKFKESGMGITKKEWVLEQVVAWLKKKNINITADEINKAIEDTVGIINILRKR